MDRRYFPVEDQIRHRSAGLIKISLAWLMGASALWLYANMEAAVDQYIVAFSLYLILTKFVGYYGWREYSISKGYKWAFGLFSYVPFIGPAFLVFLEDRWQEQEIPKNRIRKLSW
jgi:hypothetical protein